MDRNQIILLVAGLVLAGIIAVVVDVYVGLIILVIVLTLFMSLLIMADSTILPDVIATLSGDAKNVRVTNRGNAPAYSIHVAIVPLDKEYDIPVLQVDEERTYHFENMINEAKASVAFKNERGDRYEKTFRLSALKGGDEDLLKPMFPLFKWK
ncbi:hypothetical protein J2741_001106 [Methanolinea mesophila]|uniref:hypothetical protein n=1 Tax=Methanolinea mesophila TaxID=547055 RepID=UPI001AE7CE50|nr:hypothetical protein [Methanolinea mesophila]MBP1928559.1 hypothetical protein [Methanolinea mesophila]